MKKIFDHLRYPDGTPVTEPPDFTKPWIWHGNAQRRVRDGEKIISVIGWLFRKYVDEPMPGFRLRRKPHTNRNDMNPHNWFCEVTRHNSEIDIPDEAGDYAELFHPYEKLSDVPIDLYVGEPAHVIEIACQISNTKFDPPEGSLS
jgi:hypothetical protein